LSQRFEEAEKKKPSFAPLAIPRVTQGKIVTVSWGGSKLRTSKGTRESTYIPRAQTFHNTITEKNARPSSTYQPLQSEEPVTVG